MPELLGIPFSPWSEVLAMIEPPSIDLKLGPASRSAFADPNLAARYPDLLAWRDALYASYRSKPASTRVLGRASEETSPV